MVSSVAAKAESLLLFFGKIFASIICIMKCVLHFSNPKLYDLCIFPTCAVNIFDKKNRIIKRKIAKKQKNDSAKELNFDTNDYLKL